VLPALLILCASCTAGPERDDTLPPSCPGSDDPAYAYTTADDSAVNIMGLRPDAELVALTTDGGSSSPSFTPDGTSIVFARAYPGQPGASSPPSADSVWIMNADGSDPQELMRMTTVDSVSVSPDGTRMVVIGQQRSDRPDGGLYVADIDGRALRRVHAPPGHQVLFGDAPAWSPDGSEVAVVVTAGGQFAVYAVSVSDGSAREVTRSASVSHMSWSTDGATVSFVALVPRRGEDGRAVVAVDAAGGESRRVVSDIDASTMASADGTSWLAHRISFEDVPVHDLLLTGAAGETAVVALPVPDGHLVSTALAPCALR